MNKLTFARYILACRKSFLLIALKKMMKNQTLLIKDIDGFTLFFSLSVAKVAITIPGVKPQDAVYAKTA